ncbi:ferritin-like domain-containing protein [Bacillus sp. JJ722]|uniref:ferritin-like domain-containing protein n=1 Tax=Bacillus sp. JJ722 TaxID=3122973 RepID=UPI002FFF233D
MYIYTDGFQSYLRQTNKLIANIEKAINGEFSAINCYAHLAKIAPNEQERKQILEIRKDEKKHFKEFSQIYFNLTGMQPQPKITEDCPKQYIEGLEFALKDEQETVDFYLSISDDSNNAYIKETFRRAAADEQNHAVWFLYFYTKTRSKS